MTTGDATLAVGNATGEHIMFEITITNCASATQPKLIRHDITWQAATGTYVQGQGGGASTATAAVNGLQLLFESGNIASGDVTLYGVVNS
jgi:hypothetical protein